MAIVPPAPGGGATRGFPKVRSNDAILREVYQPDGWRRLTDWAERSQPALAWVLHRAGLAESDPGVKAAVLYNVIKEDWRSATVGPVAQVKRFGDSDRLFNVQTDAQGNRMAYVTDRTGATVARPLYDVLQHTQNYRLTPEQQGFADALKNFYDELYQAAKDERIPVGWLDVAGGGHYIARSVVRRRLPDGTYEYAHIVPAQTRVRTGVRAFFENERQFDTVQEAYKEGFEYAKPEDAFQLYAEAMGRRIADMRLVRYLLNQSGIKPLVVKPGQKAPFGYIDLPVPWLRNVYFKESEVKKLYEHLDIARRDRIHNVADAVAKVNEVPRALLTSMDVGVMAIQLQVLAFRYPQVFVRAVREGLRALGSEQGYQQFLATHAETIKKWAPYGAQFMPGEMTEALRPGGLLSTGVGSPIGTAIRPFNRSMEAMLNAARILGLEATQGLARTEQDKRDLARFWTLATGSTSLARMGLSPKQQAIERATFFAARYNRATLALMADIAAGGLRGGMAREALLAWTVGGLLLYLAIAKLLGQSPNLDPRSGGKFLTVEIGGQHVGVGGAFFATSRLLAQMALEPAKAPTYIARYLHSRLSPAANAGMTVLAHANYVGKPYDNPWVMTKDIVESSLTPVWLQAMLEGGVPIEDWRISPDVRDLGKRLAVGAAEFAGLRTYPVSAAERREQLREEYAASDFGKSWADLNQEERRMLQEAHQDLAQAVEQARKASVERGDVVAQFWEDVATMREPLEEQLGKLDQEVRSGLIIGNTYRQMVQDLELQIAKIPQQLKALPKYKGVPLTEAERAVYYGGKEQPPTNQVDRFIDAWYAIPAALADPETGAASGADIVELREQLKKQFPPDVVKQALAYIYRRRAPEYQQAVEQYREYQNIPRYLGMSREQANRAVAFMARYTDARQANPYVDPQVTWAKLAQFDPEGARLAKEAAKRQNPARRAYWAAHPLLHIYFSDLSPEELTVVSPSYAAMAG